MGIETEELSLLRQLGMRIAYLRKRKGMTQLDLSLETGLSKTYICDLERGARNASLLTIKKVADGLEVSLMELFKGISSLEGIL